MFLLNKNNTKIKKIFDKKRANTPNPFKRKINIDKKLISLKISENNKSNIDIIKNSKNKKKFKINKTDQNLN